MDEFIERKKIRFEKKIFKCYNFLGKGGFGSCFSFKSEDSDLKIAVKVIDKSHKKINLKAVLRETTIHRILNHENVVQYLNQCEDTTHCYIMMELCEKTLNYMFRTTQVVPLVKVQKYGKDILRGLCYLHNQNIIHRDIKMENILISYDDVAKIADFGLSRTVAELENSTKTHCCGSFHYLASEIVTTFKYTAASDIWAFGIILYRLITGNYPFFGSREELFFRIGKIIYRRSASLKINKNGCRLIQQFAHIFTQHTKRLSAAELLNRSFFTKPLEPEEGYSENLYANNDIIDSTALAKTGPPYNLRPTVGVLVRNMYNVQHHASTLVMAGLPVEDFVYIKTLLDYTHSYGLMYHLSNNIVGFLYFDLSCLLNYNDKYYYFKYLNGERYLVDESVRLVTKSKRQIFRIFRNEIIPKGVKFNEPLAIIDKPIFIDYWIQTVEFFMVVLSNGTVHIELLSHFRENTCVKYVLSGSGRLYNLLCRRDAGLLRPLSPYEQEIFFKKNPKIQMILSKLTLESVD